MANGMRLSELEKLCADMRIAAKAVGNDDLSVELFVMGELDDLTIAPMVNTTVTDYMAKYDGDNAERGDFCLALTVL